MVKEVRVQNVLIHRTGAHLVLETPDGQYAVFPAREVSATFKRESDVCIIASSENKRIICEGRAQSVWDSLLYELSRFKAV